MYLPNGTAGELWMARNCEGCVHNTEPEADGGCPILAFSVLYNYDQIAPHGGDVVAARDPTSTPKTLHDVDVAFKAGKAEVAGFLLDTVAPRDVKGEPCRMRVVVDTDEVPRG